ncbi:MAG: signal peptidase I, partial [Nitrososphaerota archaeon]
VLRVNYIIDEEPRIFMTKRDSNTSSIPGTDFPITEQEYIGKVVYVVPQIGYITRILTPPINYIIIAVIIGIMIFKQFGKSRTKPEPVILSDQPPPQDYTSLALTSSEIDRIPSSEFLKTDSSIENFDSKNPDEKED